MKLFIATLCIVAASPAIAQIPTGLEVSELSHSGDGCPTEDQGSVLGSLAANGTYGIIFAKLDAGAVDVTAPARSRCAFALNLRLPVNYKMQIDKVILQGKHDAPGESVAKAFTSYAMNGFKISYDLDPKRGKCQEHVQPSPDAAEFARNASVAAIHGIPTAAGNFDITWKNQELGHFTACGGNVEFAGDLDLLADAAGTQDLPEISVQRLDASLKYGLGWGWKFVKCREILNGLWRTTIVDRDGRAQPASMSLSFERGSISGAGQAITLAALLQEDTLVTGVWKRGSEQGWIRFKTPAAPPLNQLDGEWGIGLEPGTGVIGRITAARVH